MGNFANIINSDNNRLINNSILKPSASSCHCGVKHSCLLNSDCLQTSLV